MVFCKTYILILSLCFFFHHLVLFSGVLMFSCIPFISCNISYSFRADKPWTRLTPEDKVILFYLLFVQLFCFADRFS